MTLKQIDEKKAKLLLKVDKLTKEKKKLYSKMDITSAMSKHEKELTKEIADIFSELNKLVAEKKKLLNK